MAVAKRKGVIVQRSAIVKPRGYKLMNTPVTNEAFNRDATVIKGHLRCMGNGMKVYNKIL